MSLGRPHDRICIMIDYNRNVLVSLLIAGLINTYIHKVVKPAGSLRFNIIQGTMNASADGLPVDSHVF